MHDQIFRLAVELLGGVELQFADEHGRRWLATATCLSWDGVSVINGDAFDIAWEVARRDRVRAPPRRRTDADGEQVAADEELRELLAGIGRMPETDEQRPRHPS